MTRRMGIVAAFFAVLVCAVSSEASVENRREAASVVRAECETDAKSGPRANPDDQFRGFWLLDPSVYRAIVSAGFNLFINQPSFGIDGRAKWFQLVGADGFDYVEQLAVNQNPRFERYRGIGPDGEPHKTGIDLYNPECHADLYGTAKRLLDGIPADAPDCLMGVQPVSEVRGHNCPSYSKEFKAAWKKTSGQDDFPADCGGKYARPYREIPGFSPLRTVPDDDPRLGFYRWFYREGDGWNDYLEYVKGYCEKRFARPLFSMYDPAVRQPPIRGFAAGMSHWNQWHYVYPEPYNISYVVSEMQAMGRNDPEKGIMTMVQGISKRSALAPKSQAVSNAPVWVSDRPNAGYITTPSDMMREALWTLFSRKLDGVFVYGWRALFDHVDEKHPKDGDGYQFTDAGTIGAVSNVMNRVGIPLGPLLRAFPERPMEFAVLESFASAIFAGRCDIAWGGRTMDFGTMATAANLMPQVLYEEDLAAGGVPASVKVLAMPQCEVLAESAVRAVRAFQSRGGIVVGDELLAPAILADLDMPLVRRAGKAADDQRQVREGAARLLSDLAQVYRPPVATDTPDILAYVRSYRDSDCLFTINDRRTAGDYVGPWGKVYEKGLPSSGTVTWRRVAGAVYDLVGHRPVAFDVRNGETRIPVSLDAADGRVFLVTQRPLAPLKAESNGRTVRVTSPDAGVLIPIGVFADGRKPRYGVVRDGVYNRPFAGQNVRVVNLADGTETHATVVPAGLRGTAGDFGSDADEAVRRFVRGHLAKPDARPNERFACAGLPPSQTPGVDHQFRDLWSAEVKGGRFTMPPKMACAAVEIWLGREKVHVRARVNGVLAAEYDSRADGLREFRFEAEKVLKWGEENVVEFEDAKGAKLNLPFTVKVLKLVD